MATVATNLMINGLSGKFGNTLLFKTLRGKTFVSATPRKPDKKKESEAQRNTRSTFREAAHWAQMILHDAEKKVYYQQRARALKLPNAYTAAITDYMRKAKVKKISQPHKVTYIVSKPGFDLQNVAASVSTGGTTILQQKKDTWYVTITWPNDETPGITLLITDRAKHMQQFTDNPI